MIAYFMNHLNKHSIFSFRRIIKKSLHTYSGRERRFDPLVLMIITEIAVLYDSLHIKWFIAFMGC